MNYILNQQMKLKDNKLVSSKIYKDKPTIIKCDSNWMF